MSSPRNCLWIALVPMGLTFFRFSEGREAKFSVKQGQKVASNALHLAHLSNPNMSNVMCATYCRITDDCDLYQISAVDNVCAISKQENKFDNSVDLITDPNYTLGYIHYKFPVRDGPWRLVFRVQGRVGISAYDTWRDSTVHHDDTVGGEFPDACLSLTDYAQCDRHLRSRILDNWVDIQEVRYSLIKNGVEVAYIVFDGTNTDNLSWFSQSRILQSSWTTLKTDPDVRPLELAGICSSTVSTCRRFLVWENFEYCINEFFYTTIIESTGDSCNSNTMWVVRDLSSYPVILFAPGTGRGTLSIEQGCRNRFGETPICDYWASRGECSANPGFMEVQCRLACGLCSPNSCTNTYGDTPVCQHWANYGECANNPSFMEIECRLACGGCAPGETFDLGQEADVLAVWVKFA
ncbi:hypothetical protein RRG08_060424 [Elysia crispata]|uniref:ShKT domain-containing protein n=1 Tax=Elysia crispata TaxID=231223 RepID=A0AAE1E0J8_9GAST|nr:hypothetical protein RRG08_060424 [Elysia crispata]